MKRAIIIVGVVLVVLFGLALVSKPAPTYTEQERAEEYSDFIQPFDYALAVFVRVLFASGCVAALAVAIDAYVQRRRPLTYADERGVLPMERSALSLDATLVSDALRMYHEVRMMSAQNSASVPYQYAPHITLSTPFAQRTQGEIASEERQTLTLPDALSLSDAMLSMERGHIIYGVLPSGELLQTEFARAYHSLAHGETRNGKTNFINSIVCQLHQHATGRAMTIAMGDFKRELAGTWNASGIVSNIETAPEQIAAMLRAAMLDADGVIGRYTLFEATSRELGTPVRNLSEYEQATGASLPLSFIVVDEFNALITAANKATELRNALQVVLQTGAGAGYYVLAGMHYLKSTVMQREGSRQFVTRAHFGTYDTTIFNTLFGGNLNKEHRALITGQPGRGIIRTVQSVTPVPFQAPLCTSDDIRRAILLHPKSAPQAAPEAPAQQSTLDKIRARSTLKQ